MTDHNLLFGLIAMQSDLISMRQFVDACTLWGSRKESSLADILVEQGWLIEDDRDHVEYLLKRRLEKTGGDVRKSLSSMPEGLKSALESLGDEEIQTTLSGVSQGPRFTSAVQISPTDISEDRITRRGLHSSGGIGHVWLAHDKVLDREIALKELKADQAHSEMNRQRFFREARITAQLTHPGTVPVYDYVDDGKRSYYTMKFVRGRTFSEEIRNYHEWRIKENQTGVTSRLVHLLNQFVSICNTIAYAHSKQIIHRDLKTENVIVGDFGEVAVLDWGLAKHLEEVEPVNETVVSEFDATVISNPDDSVTSSHTMQGEKLGTPAYMSPEQARGEIAMVDLRSDVYGLAAILYEILVGQPPFMGTSIIAVLESVIHDQPQPPSESVDGLPRELEQICMRGLSKKREDRQQSAIEIGDEIQSWIAERAERKRTEQERERFFNLSLDLLAILDAGGRLALTNPAWESVLGWTTEELQGKSVWELIEPSEHPRAKKNHERILSGESLTEIEYKCRHKEGSHNSIWILWNAKLIPGESSIYLVGRDITERKRTEQTFHDLLESAPDAMVVVNESGTIVLVNAQLEKLFGYDRSELLGNQIEYLVPKQFRAEHPQKVASFIQQASARPMASGLNLFAERKDGAIFPVEISLSPVKTEQGLLVSCAVRDTTLRMKEQNKIQALLDSAPDAMVVVNRQRQIEFVNFQAERLFGYQRQELLGQEIEVLIPPRFREGHPEKFERYANSPSFRPLDAKLNLSGLHKDGSEFPAEISLNPIELEEGLLISSTIRRTHA
ncbi:PAS domain S-box protein [Gimesia algae]|uniref:Serine/threonine-protein kinase PknD n=1 Tax=Gimesia algae TaxID=2527971 RepID=A0A517VAC5_9PLAN|nr:PAS domain S-box protein [Gimesia algae]QDT89957.1 Serine/threonine-protein kinase PknD [Gimesia algae]